MIEFVATLMLTVLLLTALVAFCGIILIIHLVITIKKLVRRR